MRRSLGRRGNSMGGNHGPLMTEHLQDIDLELELLKRKREMIEQQQQLLAMEQQFKSSRHSYDQMRYDEPDQHGSNRDYNHMYDSGPKRNQFGRKRQPEPQWQYDGPPKKNNPKKKPLFNPNSHPGPANARNQRSNPGPHQGSRNAYSQPAPLMDIKIKQSIGQKIANQKMPQPKKNFSPTKVTKSKAPPAPNKLASHSVAERKNLVAVATKVPSGDMANMLLPDRVPSQQVSGRLELALGAIMKNVRGLIDKKPEHAALLRTLPMQRVMKQAVRERIRNVMLGKVVGSLLDILAIYRAEFPEETDLDILNLAIQAGGAREGCEQKPSRFIQAEDPGEFFRINISGLIESKLNELFLKLEEIVNEDEKARTSSDNPENSENSDNVEKPENSENSGNLENSENPEIPEKSESPQNGIKTEQPEASDNSEKADNPENQADLSSEKAKTDKEEPSQEYKDFLNTTIHVHQIRRVLPRLVKRFTPYIIKLMNVDSLYQSTKAAIIMETNEKAAKITGIKLSDVPEPEVKVAPEIKEPVEQTKEGGNRAMYNLPYYVKIMGRPSLPKRRTMQGFLNKFNPKSIKKHRTIHNLLFVGFAEKADFDAMVAADGTVIGKSTLSVRVCSKDNQNSNTEQNSENREHNGSLNVTDVSMTEVKNEQSSDEIISSDLDNQITDLLSTIRKAEENNENDTSNTEVEGQIDTQQDENNSSETNKVEQDENEVLAEAENDENGAQEEASDEVQAENNKGQEEQASDDAPKQDTESNNDSKTQEPVEQAADQKAEPEVTQPQDSAEENGENVESTNNANSESNGTVKKAEQDDDKLGELKAATTGRSTPTRMSARLANVTPSSIRTRRASRLAQN